MVSQEQPTLTELREQHRQAGIERALAAGDHELAEFYRIVEFDDEVTPEEAEEIERAFEAADRQTEWEAPGAFLKEWEEEDPEFVRLLDRLDERFPGWPALMSRLPEEHPSDLALLRKIDKHEPEGGEFLRGIHAEMRAPLAGGRMNSSGGAPWSRNPTSRN